MTKYYLLDDCFSVANEDTQKEIGSLRDSVMELMKDIRFSNVFAALYEVQRMMIYRHDMSDGSPELIRFLNASCNSLEELVKERDMTVQLEDEQDDDL